jgi:hypothetical protein
MALLVFSDKCQFSREIINYIRSQPALINIVRFHNVATHGVPSKQITRTPTLVTNEGNLHVGRDVKTWLESMVPAEFVSWDTTLDFCSNLDGSECHNDMFDLDRYGESLQPELTPELELRISRSVNDAMAEAKQRTS